ncbi:MAG: hypothetical protein WC466_06870 [Candidatus Izemoplasmatales bacterium]
MKTKIVNYLLNKQWFISIVSKRFYTKDQLEGIYWQGVLLGSMKHQAVERITDKRLKEELQKYIQMLDELNA